MRWFRNGLLFLTLSSTVPAAARAGEPKRPESTASAVETAAGGNLACDGRGRRGWLYRGTVLGLTNPLGAVVDSKAGWCRPLVRRPGLLWKLTALETGARLFVTPSFLRAGAYLDVSPLSFLVLRVGVGGVWYWPLPGFRAAAYWHATGYDQTMPSNGINNDITVDREHGVGLNVSASLVFRGSVVLKRFSRGPLELIVLDALALEYWYMGTHDYYYNQRADTVMQRSDYAVVNNAVLMLSLPLTAKASMRVGATDSLTYLPRAGAIAVNQVGGLLMWPIRGVHRSLSALTPFLRVTGFTHHMTRDLSFGLNVLIGVDLAVRL